MVNSVVTSCQQSVVMAPFMFFLDFMLAIFTHSRETPAQIMKTRDLKATNLKILLAKLNCSMCELLTTSLLTNTNVVPLVLKTIVDVYAVIPPFFFIIRTGWMVFLTSNHLIHV